MAEITDITLTKRGRYALFLDGEFAFSVDDETLVENHLKKGKILNDDDISAIRGQNDYRYAKQQALKLLSYKDYTSQMLIQRLIQKEIDEDSAVRAVKRMEELGLVNDLDYAMRCSRDLMNLKSWSTNRIRMELKRRLVPEYAIDEAIAQFDELDPEPKIAKIILKKYFRDLDTPKGKNRAAAGLCRLGYSPGQVFAVISNLLDDPDYYNEHDI